MPGFVYFLPNAARDQVTIQRLRDVGLGYAFEDRVSSALVVRGPDGQRGMLVGDPQRVDENQLGYFPDRQHWREMPPAPGGAGPIWLGWPQNVKLRPEDLCREEQIKGYWVRLADGQKWLVPIARKSLPDEENALRYAIALPHVAGINASGEWANDRVVPAYEPLWQVASAFWESLLGAVVDGENATLNFSDTLDSAVKALAANYRIGPAEATALELLTMECAVEVLQSLVDWPTLKEWFAKRGALDQAAGIGG